MYSLYNFYSFESFCNNVIEDEIDVFYRKCLSSAYSYSLDLCNNSKLFSKTQFKNLVIDTVDLVFLFNNIFKRISDELLDTLDLNTLDHKNINHNVDSHLNEARFNDSLMLACDILANEIVSNSFNSIAHDMFLMEINKESKTLTHKHEELYNKIRISLIESKPRIKEVITGITLNNSPKLSNSLVEKYVS